MYKYIYIYLIPYNIIIIHKLRKSWYIKEAVYNSPPVHARANGEDPRGSGSEL